MISIEHQNSTKPIKTLFIRLPWNKHHEIRIPKEQYNSFYRFKWLRGWSWYEFFDRLWLGKIRLYQATKEIFPDLLKLPTDKALGYIKQLENPKIKRRLILASKILKAHIRYYDERFKYEFDGVDENILNTIIKADNIIQMHLSSDEKALLTFIDELNGKMFDESAIEEWCKIFGKPPYGKRCDEYFKVHLRHLRKQGLITYKINRKGHGRVFLTKLGEIAVKIINEEFSRLNDEDLVSFAKGIYHLKNKWMPICSA